ncbi:Hypothetical_protein [Hexamita inflata]|uniref:Hypothetical_protein n=1 Tax=Hexamita inflata TaxID=28002 RepID=A0AA86RBF9_9EUKA|nr:Hypothetical protein HINF_LOCUS59203 [Hexamita inflata]
MNIIFVISLHQLETPVDYIKDERYFFLLHVNIHEYPQVSDKRLSKELLQNERLNDVSIDIESGLNISGVLSMAKVISNVRIQVERVQIVDSFFISNLLTQVNGNTKPVSEGAIETLKTHAKSRQSEEKTQTRRSTETVSDQHLTETSDSLNSSISDKLINQINQNESYFHSHLPCKLKRDVIWNDEIFRSFEQIGGRHDKFTPFRAIFALLVIFPYNNLKSQQLIYLMQLNSYEEVTDIKEIIECIQQQEVAMFGI